MCIQFKPEDFLKFDSLVAIDGSDNHLPFGMDKGYRKLVYGMRGLD